MPTTYQTVAGLPDAHVHVDLDGQYDGNPAHSNPCKEPSKAEDRALRFDLNLPIRFHCSDGMITGHCVNISASGMLAVFDRKVDIWQEGEVSAFSGERHLIIEARVARIDGRDIGLHFKIVSEDDQNTIRRLLSLAHERERAMLLSPLN